MYLLCLSFSVFLSLSPDIFTFPSETVHLSFYLNDPFSPEYPLSLILILYQLPNLFYLLTSLPTLDSEPVPLFLESSDDFGALAEFLTHGLNDLVGLFNSFSLHPQLLFIVTQSVSQRFHILVLYLQFVQKVTF